MNLSSISINRPVLSSVLSLVIFLFGLIAFTFLGVREYPSVDPPIISVRTNYPGANANIIETQITEILEESINGVAGINSLSSISSDGRSSITVEFNLDTDLEAAANDVRDRVSRAVRNLPPEAEPPIVTKADADATTILAMTVQSNERNLMELTEFADRFFKERLQTIDGISKITIWGSKEYSMRLKMDPVKIKAYGLSPQDIRLALQRENVELPSGKIEGYRSELSIRTFGRLETPDEFNNLIIREDGNNLIRFKDIGQASIEPLDQQTLLRGNGLIPMVGIAVTPLPGANYISIADEFYKRVEQLKKDMPDDLELGYAIDTTLPIRAAIDDVTLTIVLAFSLVILIIFFFLRDWRSTLIPAIAIPISLVGAFFIMYLFDFSINILTLLGVVLATGLVVDDAIVMLENIYQKIESGQKSMQAAHEGAREIFFAIIATTVTLVAVFLPVIFLQGLTGKLFQEFGIVVAGAVIISTFVSLTLTPTLSARILKKKDLSKGFYARTEKHFRWLTDAYKGKLRPFLRNRWISPLAIILAAAGTYFLYSALPSELAPREDKSGFRIIATAPEGVSYELMDQYVLDLLRLVDTIPEKEALISVTAPSFGSSTSVNSAFMRVTLKQPDQRERSQGEVVKSIYPKLKKLSFANAFISQSQTIEVSRSFGGLPVAYVLQAPDLNALREILPRFMESAAERPEFNVLDLNLKFTKPEINIRINRERARSLGVSARDIAETIQLYFNQQRLGYFIKNNKQYEVVGEADRNHRDQPDDILSLALRNQNGELIPISDIIDIEERSTPPQIFHYNRYTSATISADLAAGYTIGQGIQAMDEISAELLPDNFKTDLSGTSKEFRESAGGLSFAFLLALALVYLALAAQFESYVDPLIIMFTVPLALIGALFSLWLLGHTLNIFSQIGMIVLIGIVTKNGILIVEFANQKLAQGHSKLEAIINASASRFRPILMTSLATSLGTLPIALALGSAATSRIPMGVAIIGGLIFAMILTLFIIPGMYLLISRKKPAEHA
ncbi:MAG: MMPL family transporter [Bacteroidetes bacterium]|jgi:multidrug efflux pump|nr:MMPL family transporter [Bacteroidota bacterium]